MLGHPAHQEAVGQAHEFALDEEQLALAPDVCAHLGGLLNQIRIVVAAFVDQRPLG